MRPTGTVGTFVGEMSTVTWDRGGPSTLPTSWQVGACVQVPWGGGGEGVPVVMVTVQKEVSSPKVSLVSFLPGEETAPQQPDRVYQCMPHLF